MPDILVDVPSAQYTVHLGAGVLTAVPSLLAALPGRISAVFVVTSAEIEAHWGAAVTEPLRHAGFAVRTLRVPAGEVHKRLATLERLCEELAGAGADRDALLIALGGGVIGDVTGFLAAIYMRGIRFVQVPTTLLAQVDSSVGGKTGVNLAAGKNLVGSFHQPVAVVADLDTLKTLPSRELRAGLQESVKSAIIRDPSLFAYMESHAGAVLVYDPSSLEHVIEASIRVKAAVVAEDEREGGLRMILNFGHTVGHATEAATEYKALLHGEAIGWGMLAAIHLSRARGVLRESDAERMRSLIRGYANLPFFAATAERLVELTHSDKKNRGGTLSFILPVGIGHVEVVNDVTAAELTQAVEAMLDEVRTADAIVPLELAHAG